MHKPKPSTRLTILVFALALGACAGDSPPGDVAGDKEAAREAIWAKEQAVYAARRRADPQFYIDNASEQYVGWSPNWDAPAGLDLLRAGVSRVQGQVHEELSLEFKDIAVSGNAAVIYYRTHRTRLPTGEEVDQRFDIAHIWVKEADEWKLLGALGRSASPGYDPEKATEEIWAREQAIYAARGEGDLQFYVDNASEHYMGWPPGWPKPSGIDQLRAGVEQMRGLDQEELAMEFGDITFSGNTAVIYYSTHRTRMPTGEEVDQRFHIAHVWAREGSGWKLVGALGRMAAPPG